MAQAAEMKMKQCEPGPSVQKKKTHSKLALKPNCQPLVEEVNDPDNDCQHVFPYNLSNIIKSDEDVNEAGPTTSRSNKPVVDHDVDDPDKDDNGDDVGFEVPAESAEAELSQ